MCRDRESIARLDRATNELMDVCQRLCTDDLGLSLRVLYSHTLDEGVKPDEQALLDKLQ